MTKGVDQASNWIFLIILVGMIIILLMVLAFWYTMENRAKGTPYFWQGWVGP